MISIVDKHEARANVVEVFSFCSLKDCRYFDKGLGDCPFGTSCFYRHGKLLLFMFSTDIILVIWFLQSYAYNLTHDKPSSDFL